MKIQGAYQRFFPRKSSVEHTRAKEENSSQEMDKFTKSLYQEMAYAQYTKVGRGEAGQERKIVGLTEEQFEAMMNGELGEVQSDGKNYWIIIEGTKYEFRKLECEDEEIKDTQEILLETVEECLERVQENLDEKFRKWTMKEDIRYPNKGKNAMITLEDVLKRKEERDVAVNKHKEIGE